MLPKPERTPHREIDAAFFFYLAILERAEMGRINFNNLDVVYLRVQYNKREWKVASLYHNNIAVLHVLIWKCPFTFYEAPR